MSLQAPTTNLPGVGPKLAQILIKCQIHTIEDLLFYLPYRYQDRTRITPMRDLRDRDWAVVEGEVIKQEIRRGKKAQLVCYLQDKNSFIKLRFFHFHHGLKDTLSLGTTIRCFGEAKLISQGFEMAHPEIQVINEERPTAVEETLTPIYSLTQGISQIRLRQLTKHALNFIKEQPVPDLIPIEILNELNYPSIQDALNFLHTPPRILISTLYLREDTRHNSGLPLKSF